MIWKDKPRIVYAGDREISVKILDYLLEQGHRPLALLTSDKNKATHADQLAIRCNHLDKNLIMSGNNFRISENIKKIKNLKPDYILGIHFPYIISKEVLEIPTQGILNLHPAYLPFNKGFHTPTWAIMEETPYGGTLHFMSEELDRGDIVHQKKIEIKPSDTANSLYKRVLDLEVEIFKEAWPSLENFTYKRIQQNEKGTSHISKDLAKIQEIDLTKDINSKEILNRLRALTTNKIEEAAYFIINEKKYYVQVTIKEEDK